MTDHKALRKLAEAATEGPWEYSVYNGSDSPATLFTASEDADETDIAEFEIWDADGYDKEMIANAKLITASRTAIPALLDEVEASEKLNESLIEDKFTKHGNGYGFVATDAKGDKVWVNSVSIAIEQLEAEKVELCRYYTKNQILTDEMDGLQAQLQAKDRMLFTIRRIARSRGYNDISKLVNRLLNKKGGE